MDSGSGAGITVKEGCEVEGDWTSNLSLPSGEWICRDLARGEGEGEGDVWVAIKEALPGSGADFLGGFDDGGLV